MAAKRFAAAGFTDAAYRACLEGAVADYAPAETLPQKLKKSGDALTVTLHLATLSQACRDLAYDAVMADFRRRLDEQ